MRGVVNWEEKENERGIGGGNNEVGGRGGEKWERESEGRGEVRGEREREREWSLKISSVSHILVYFCEWLASFFF